MGMIIPSFPCTAGAEVGASEKANFEQERAKALKNPFANDLGPDRIDVSAYPPYIKEGYEILQVRCARCHSPARPLNSQFSKPDEWERYVKRMMRKPGSDITGQEGRKIYEFLAYDSKIRKLDHPEAWRAHRKNLLEEFKKKYPARYDELYGESEKNGGLR